MAVPIAVSTSESPTAAERERAIQYLEQTRDQLSETVRALTPGQWTFKSGPDVWSVLDNVEHLAIIGGIVKLRLGALATGVPSDPGRNAQEVDATILATVPDRTTRFKGPEVANPTNRWTSQEVLEQYREICADMIEIVRSSTGLRQTTFPHPVLGQLDGYQWILAVAGHNDRHHRQILEVLAGSNFPQS